MINRDTFYRRIQSNPFPGSLAISQRKGMDVILDEWDRRGLTELPFLAYMLATTFHETARTMQPVIETFNPRYDKVNPSVDEAIRRLESAHAQGRIKAVYWRKDAQGRSWLGRGFVQLTWPFNYQKAALKTGLPLTTQPELMLEAGPACRVMFDGMLEGWFTGKKLADYRRPDGGYDFVNARRIINGLDHAQEIAATAQAFLTALIAANVGGAPSPPDVQSVAQQPVSSALTPAQKGGIGTVVAGWIAGLWAFVLDHPWATAGASIAAGLLIYAIIKSRKDR